MCVGKLTGCGTGLAWKRQRIVKDTAARIRHAGSQTLGGKQVQARAYTGNAFLVSFFGGRLLKDRRLATLADAI